MRLEMEEEGGKGAELAAPKKMESALLLFLFPGARSERKRIGHCVWRN